MACTRTSIGVFLFILQCCLILAQDKPCGDHDVKVTNFGNCPEPSPKNQNIRIHNLTLTLTDDCRLVPRGCFKVRKAIPAAKVLFFSPDNDSQQPTKFSKRRPLEYYINKPPFKKKGTEDFCKVMESPDAQKSFESYKSVPKKCTIPPGEYCINKGSTKVEQLNPKTLNLMTGTTTGYFSIENEGSSDKGCVEFKLIVTKKG